MPSSSGSDGPFEPYLGPRRLPSTAVRRQPPLRPSLAPRPPRTVVTPNVVDPPSRRQRIVAMVLSISLCALVVGVWLTPAIRLPQPGPTPLEVELATERARSGDLARQNADLSNKLKAARPPVVDDVNAARAEDLLHQVEELEDKLGIPRPPKVDGVQKARADDLQTRLKAAEDRLKQKRPPATDTANRARADDLAQRLADANAQLTRPRPTPDPLANVTATMTKTEIVSSRNLFGLYTTQSPFNYGEVDLVTGVVQRKPNIVGYFQSWNDPFNAFPLKNAWSRGQIPLMTWESQDQVGNITFDQAQFSLPRIINGDYDAYIRSYARGIHDLKLPVIIRLDHEMNGNWYPWSEWADVTSTDHPVVGAINGNNKGDYAKMWRHVHNIFSSEGANDYTIWLWSPNRINRICGQRRPGFVEPGQDPAFWPGDAYVDWVGMSGYYRNYESAGGKCDDISATFNAVFGNTLPYLRSPLLPTVGKPVFLSEIGATERGGDKARWIADLFRGLQDNHQIIGFAWFNLAVSSGGETDRFTHDWRINSSGDAQIAMRNGLQASTYGLPPAG